MELRTPSLTDDEKAASGPLPGDLQLYARELEAARSASSPGYYPSLNAAEIADSRRSGLFPAASFGGSLAGDNAVFAWRAEDDYPGCTFITNRRPGEIYVMGGNLPKPKPPVMPGPYVAKADGTTGRQLWRTYLENANVNDVWVGATNLNVLDSGHVVTSWCDRVALVDGDSGLILAYNELPTGETAPRDCNFKHLTVAPDGTLILKNQARPAGMEEQGTLALIKGVRKGLKQTSSVLVAVHPETLEVLHWVQLHEPCTTPHCIDLYEGRVAIYISADAHAYRYFWDPDTKRLSQDESWTVSYLEEGQTTGDAPALMGEWVTIQTNGLGSKSTASSVVAIHSKDSSRRTTVYPFGELRRTEYSFAPPKSGADPENNLLYSADAGLGKFAGLSFDPDSGRMRTEFVIDASTFAFQPLIGPKDGRVLMVSHMKPRVQVAPRLPQYMLGQYHEQVLWLDPRTGRRLAESSPLEPLSPGSLMVPAFGGRTYFPTQTGFYTLQVRPKRGAA